MTIEFHYRIISEPSWQVQSLHDGKWVTMWWCKDETAATRRLCKQVEAKIAAAKMTPDERMRSILR